MTNKWEVMAACEFDTCDDNVRIVADNDLTDYCGIEADLADCDDGGYYDEQGNWHDNSELTDLDDLLGCDDSIACDDDVPF